MKLRLRPFDHIPVFRLSVSCMFAAAALAGSWDATGEETPAVRAVTDIAAQLDEPAPPGDSVETENAATGEDEPDPAKDEPAKTENAESKPEDKPGKTEKESGEESDETIATPKKVGNPLAAGMVKLLRQEIEKGIKRRGLQARFAKFRSYAAYQLDSSKARHTGSELMGNCRLRWYDHLLRNPLSAPAEAEKFTRTLHQDLIDHHEGLGRALATAADKLDLKKRTPRKFAPVTSSQGALDTVEKALTDAQLNFSDALATLTKEEIQSLRENLYSTLTDQNGLGHTLADRSTGRWLCDMLEKLDRDAMHRAAEALVPLADPQLLKQLATIPDSDVGGASVAGAAGKIVRRIDTPSGAIIIGGRGRNAYRLDDMTDVNVVIDLGGDDVYYEGTVSWKRPVLIVLDLGGNDRYSGKSPGVQGSAILGVSMLLDAQGNDIYGARDVAQGSCIAGAGILIDGAGNDIYQGVRRVQGQALGGFALLLDRGGDDSYRGAMWTQGFAGPLAFAVLDDLDGKDMYYTGGLYLDNYKETPGYEGWGQGVGAGFRQVANGGFGVILDGGGNDVYEFDYLSHGGGYWCGTGFARDFGGNDRRLGATRKAYNGAERSESRFQRFGGGWGCHYAQGFLFDDEGDDTYDGTIMGVGFAWDCAVGYLCDFGGNDRYLATGGNTQGEGAQMGLGVIYDYSGDDVYEGFGQGYADPGTTYHPLSRCGGNFSFVIDYGGKDAYGCEAGNNAYTQRGDYSGFLIDRPSREEARQRQEAKKRAAEHENTRSR